MVYTVKHNGKTIRLGRTRNAFATKKEAEYMRDYMKLQHPRMKDIRVVKLKKA